MELSIIVPVYKIEAFLPKCIESILAQTFTDFELILVDDGSPDGCGEICDRYAAVEPRIRVIHQENAGVSAARNAGLDIAKGNYVCFVDSDDLIHPRMMELLIHALKKENADISFCHVQRFWGEDYQLCSIPPNWIDQLQCMLKNEFIDAFFPENRYLLRSELWNKIYKRSIFEHIRFLVGKIYEDAFAQLAILNAAEKIVHVPLVLYYYRQRPGSIMHSKYDLGCAEDMDAVSRFNLEFFREKGDVRQTQYALEAYLTMFCRDKTMVYVAHPQLREGFKPIEDAFNKEFWPMLFDPMICKMKKVVLVILRFSPRLALKICRRYLPDCLHRDLR